MPLTASNRVIMDAVHGLIDVDPRFWRVVDSPEVQRLRWIRQTGMAYLVYPGAEHSRFAHAIGAYGVAKRTFHQLRSETGYSGLFSPSHLDADLELAFTTAALCHDLGHTAFSHVLERLLLPEGFRTHEDCTLALVNDGEVGKRIRDIGCDLDQVLQLLRGSHWNDGLCKLLSGHIDVDRWDYLLRDAAATGLVYGNYDLDRMIHALSLYPDAERRPRLLIEAHRGLASMEHYLAARRSMYQQVYYHATVRGAERLLRAVFERACDPALPTRYKEDVATGIPNCLRNILHGNRPDLAEFLQTDDTTIIEALKRWSSSAADPILRYLAKCLIERRLFKEIKFESSDVEGVRTHARAAAREAFARQTASDLPQLADIDDQSLEYFVLVDSCEFKAFTGFDGVLFDTGGAIPRAFDEVQSDPEYDIMHSQRAFTRTRIFVASELMGSVKAALREVDYK